MKDPILNEPSVKSNCSEWIQWHKDLKSVFGKKTANSIFIAFWKKRGSTSANTNELRTYAKDQGFSIVGGTLSGVVDSAYDVFDSFGDIFKVGKIATISIIIIVIGGLGMLIFNVARKPTAAISAASFGAAKGMKGGI
jgi:hypothetical protein